MADPDPDSGKSLIRIGNTVKTPNERVPVLFGQFHADPSESESATLGDTLDLKFWQVDFNNLIFR